MARAFDDQRRSIALVRLVNIINEGLLTDEELKQPKRWLCGVSY